MNDIIDSIGLPAVLEQFAEECSELAQASLKYARLLRGDNPTPKTKEQCIDDLTEEIADVLLCINILYYSEIIDEYHIVDIMNSKLARWKERLEAHHEEH